MAIEEIFKESGTEKDRRTLNEIIITAVVFGFTLNIISDFILSFPILLVDTFMFGWYFFWSGVSFLGTLYLLYRLFSLYLGDDSSIEHEFMIAIVWGAKDGSPRRRRDTGYNPQVKAPAIFAALDDKSKERIQEVVKSGPEALQESSLPIQLSEVLFLDNLTLLMSIGKNIFPSIPLHTILKTENVFVTSDLANTDFHYFGEWKANCEVAKNGSRTLRISWKGPFHGSVSFKIEIVKVGWFNDFPDETIDDFYSYEYAKTSSLFWKLIKEADPKTFSNFPDVMIPQVQPTGSIRSDVSIKVNAKFSPIYLQYGWGKTDQTIPWLKSQIWSLFLLLDWSTYLKIMRDAKQSGFENGQFQ